MFSKYLALKMEMLRADICMFLAVMGALLALVGIVYFIFLLKRLKEKLGW